MRDAERGRAELRDDLLVLVAEARVDRQARERAPAVLEDGGDLPVVRRGGESDGWRVRERREIGRPVIVLVDGPRVPLDGVQDRHLLLAGVAARDVRVHLLPLETALQLVVAEEAARLELPDVAVEVLRVEAPEAAGGGDRVGPGVLEAEEAGVVPRRP